MPNAHHVFFVLKERSDENCRHLVQEIRSHLSNYPGQIYFEVGTRDRGLDREVNQDFDVSLHTVFENREAHDAYQDAPRHREFVERNVENWAEVRVFDSNLTAE